MNKFLYINQLNSIQINHITAALKQIGIIGEDLKNALDSRLIDLEDVIDINKI